MVFVLGSGSGGHALVVFGGYDHYRPTMTHLLHGLLEERHNGRVTHTLGVVLGCATLLLGRVGVRRVRGAKGGSGTVRGWEKRRWRWSRWHSRTTMTY